MKILLLGSTGMLGFDCKEVLGRDYDIVSPTRKELDIISWDKVIETLQRVKPHVVLNCAGFTDVDECESEPFLVRKANVEGPRNLAQGSARFNCKVIQISSDYVFSGKKNIPQPYFEDDAMTPLSSYGKSKMESEVGVRENAPNYIIVRSGWLYGRHGHNFVHSILSATLGKKRKTLKVVNDQFGSPTWTFRLAHQIKELIKTNAKGTFHATSEGHCSRLEWARFVFKKLKMKITLEPVGLHDYPQKAKRPLNCILENRLLKKEGISVMPDWETDLEAYLEEFGGELVKEAKAGTL